MSEKLLSSLAADRVVELPLSLIKSDPDQPRREFDKKSLEELAANIKERGVLQPITVRKSGKGGVIIKMGERRFRAAGMAKLKTIPCVLDDSKQDELERGIDQIAENEFRKGLNPIDLSAFLVRLRDKGKSVNAITDLMAKAGLEASRPAISNLMRLAELPDWSKKMVREGALTASHGKYLLQAPNIPAIQEALRELVEEEISYQGKLTVQETERLVDQAMRNTGKQLTFPAHYPITHPDRPLFDLSICKTCEFHREHGENRYCFNAAEFDKKQKAAKATIKADPSKAPKQLRAALEEEAERQARVDKARASNQANSDRHQREQKLEEYFFGKLRIHLAAAHFPLIAKSRPELALQLAVFASTGMPNGGQWDGTGNPDVADDSAKVIGRIHLQHFLSSPIEEHDIFRVAQASIIGMGETQLLDLARHLKLAAAPLFYVDAEYLDLLKDSQLAPLCKAAGIKSIVGLAPKAIRDLLLQPQHVKAIGIPKDLRSLFDKPIKSPARPSESERDKALRELGAGYNEKEGPLGRFLNSTTTKSTSAAKDQLPLKLPSNAGKPTAASATVDPAQVSRFEGEGGAIAQNRDPGDEHHAPSARP